MLEQIQRTWKPVGAFVLALVFTWFLHGAVPFLALPTLGQAVWTTGFSQSFLNDSVFSIYARNFGAPEPAANFFGLAGSWPTALFMRLGLQPTEAYSSMVALWLFVVLVSAYGIGRFFSVSPMLSIWGAVCWVTMPVIWGLASYSMLSIGISLLPFYFLAVLHLFAPNTRAGMPGRMEAARQVVFYLAVCVISIFMEGYSFMMFAVGASLLGAWLFVGEAGSRRRLLCFSFPVHCLCLGVAYLLYALYIGKTQFEPGPFDFFKTFGVDVTFLLIPTRGVHWLPDLLGWNLPRSGDTFYGDASVWTTSFAIPLIIGSVLAALCISVRKSVAIGLMLVAAFGFYMALGPVLKVNAVRPAGEKFDAMMAENYDIAPTGSALLSKNLPGFKSMRAAHRWEALGAFGAWALLILAMSSGNKKAVVAGAGIMVGMVAILNLPNLPQKLSEDIRNREMFLSMESELVDEMKGVISPYEKVAFLPWRNDFLATYVASRLNAVAYNVGCDKNVAEARLHWPETMRQFPRAAVDDGFAVRVLLVLARHEADVVILPYIDLQRAAHRWPYPVQFRDQLAPAEAELIGSGFVSLEKRTFYSAVRLKPEFALLAQKGTLETAIRRSLCLPPDCVRREGFGPSTLSRVGTVQNGRLASSGRAGILHFGPYVPMKGGEYRLVVRGVGEITPSAWVDIVSGKGRVRHGRFALASTRRGDGVLAEGPIKLDAPVNDLEIRVHVGAEDDVSLEGYELVPVAQN